MNLSPDMDDAREAMATAAEQTEKRLLRVLASKDTSSEIVGTLLSQYRALCETLIFLDFEQSEEVEKTLWEAHTEAKKRFEKLLRHVRSEDAKRKPVERRKTEKNFLDFIKSSMRFYRGYINRLASHFADVPDILQVARELHLETLSVDDLVTPSPQVKELLKSSCHSTLIRLGDLSRWRETGLQTKERNWGPARRYYGLATFVDPISGVSYNQLAVIAGAEEDHLRTMYCLYRALAAEHLFQKAGVNLLKEFEKVLKSHKEGRLLNTDVASNEMTGLRGWLLVYHAKCFAKEEFLERRALEDEIFSQLTVELKQRMPETDYVAQKPMTDKRGPMTPESIRLIQCFNIETFVRLLLVLNAELNQHTSQEESNSNSARLQASTTKLTPTIRRTLPALRHYSSWLLSSCSQWPVATAEIQIRRFWVVYAQTMNALLASFDPIQRLPKTDYMLEEDDDTAYFEPFKSELGSRRFRQTDDTLKPSSDGPDVKKLDPDEEMLARVLDLVVDALNLYSAKPDFPPGTVPLDIIVVGGKQRFTTSEPQARAFNHSPDPDIGNVTDQRAGRRQVDGSITPPLQVQRGPDEHFPPRRSATFRAETAQSCTSPQNAPFIVTDLVQRMQQSPSSSNGSKEVQAESREAKAPRTWQTETAPFSAVLAPDDSVEFERRLSRDRHMAEIASTPVPLSSGSMFHHEILRQQQLVQQQATPVQTTVQPSSWASVIQSSQPKRASNQFASSLCWTESPTRTQGSPDFGYEVPRKSPQPALYGAIGQTPPSAQIS